MTALTTAPEYIADGEVQSAYWCKWGVKGPGVSFVYVNADFSRRAIIVPCGEAWVASPQHGVDRIMLDRIGAEVARATSLVRYAPNSRFPRHFHPGGEEILVLGGVFSDAGGHYPSGWYLRNPAGSFHEPHSVEGAVIFVKLQQFAQGDTATVRIDTRDPDAWREQDGRAVCPLHSFGTERVCVTRVRAGEAVLREKVNGAELLILCGSLVLDGVVYERDAWLRLPAGPDHHVIAGSGGAMVFVKTGHLPATNRQGDA